MISSFASIIVPVAKFHDRLRLVLTSITATTLDGHAFDVIVVDNTPAGDLAKSCEIPAGVRVVREPLRGASRARNRGASSSQARWYIFCDDDVVVDPGWGQHFVEQVRAHPYVSAFACAVIPRPLSNELLHEYRKALADHLSLGTGCLLVRTDSLPTLNSSFCAIRSDAFNGVGGFDDHLLHLEDTELGIRLLRYGHHLMALTSYPASVYYMDDDLPAYLLRRFRKGFWHPQLLDAIKYPRFARASSPVLGSENRLSLCLLDLLLQIMWYLGFAIGVSRAGLRIKFSRTPWSNTRQSNLFNFSIDGEHFFLSPEVGIIWTPEQASVFLCGYQKVQLDEVESMALQDVARGTGNLAVEFYQKWISEGLFVSRPKTYELLSPIA